MLKGVAASSGIAIGKAYKLESPQIVITKTEGNPDEEKALFNKAVTESIGEIEKIKEKAAGKLSDEELEIFDAHLAVANDPSMKDGVEGMIDSDHVNAAYALDEFAKNMISIFNNMDDEYMKARAADIKDVTDRIKYHILGITVADLSLLNEESIIVADDLTPSDTAQMDKQYAKGFVTAEGSRTSHSAIMARSLEVPAIVGVKGLMDQVSHGDMLIVDALKGVVMINPDQATIDQYRQKGEEYQQQVAALKKYKDVASVTTDGHKVLMVANIGTPDDTAAVIDNGAEGVGLFRTEFLYMNAKALPTEEEQFEAYKKVMIAMSGKPVVVRTLDIGGDKKLPYLPIEPEMNPFLGYRAIRICLDQPDIFRTQLRALLRASAYGHLCIMFPMIATVDEFKQARAYYDEERAKLIAEGVKVGDDVEVGMMVEIPAAAVLADQFAKLADFFSIGTNDLNQYTMAADRMSPKVSYLYQPYNPSILRLIANTIKAAHSGQKCKWCGMCGEMAGEKDAVPVLMGLDLDEFSMSASSILKARSIANSLDYQFCRQLADKALQCSSCQEVLDLIHSEIKD